MLEPDTEPMELLLDAWAIVDWANRLRTLIPGVPGLKRRSPSVELLVRALAPVEASRDRIQHLDAELAADLASPGQAPVLGLLRWTLIQGDRAAAVATAAVMVPSEAGERTVQIDLPRDPAGTVVRPPVDRIRLAPSRIGKELDLSAIVDAVAAFDRSLRAAVRVASADQADALAGGSGVVLALRCDPVPDPDPPRSRRVRLVAVDGLEASIEGHRIQAGRVAFEAPSADMEKPPPGE